MKYLTGIRLTLLILGMSLFHLGFCVGALVAGLLITPALLGVIFDAYILHRFGKVLRAEFKREMIL